MQPDLRTLLLRSHAGLLAAQAVLVPVSFLLASVSPFGLVQPEETAVFDGLGLAGASRLAEAWLARPAARGALFVAWLALATAPALVALRALARRASEADDALVRDLARWTRRHALLPLLVLPMGALDLWICLVWGRMVVAGGSPYYDLPTPAALKGIPLAPFDHFSPYGPLSTWIDAALAFVAGGSAVALFLLHKASFAAAWLATLALIDRALAAASAERRAQAMLVFGWLPIGWLYWVGEGHNDGFMIAPLVAWLVLLREGRHALALPSLVASIAAKYATAPFLALELWAAARMPRERRRGYAVAAAVSLAAVALLIAPLARDASFLDPLLGQGSWKILTPSHALKTLVLWTTGANLRWKLADALVAAPLLGGLLAAGLRFARGARFDDAVRVVLLALLLATFVGMDRTWPWYLTWVLPVAALAETGALVQAVVALLAVAPLLSLLWLGTGWESGNAVAVATYLAWLPAFVLVRRGGLVRPWTSG